MEQRGNFTPLNLQPPWQDRYWCATNLWVTAPWSKEVGRLDILPTFLYQGCQEDLGDRRIEWVTGSAPCRKSPKNSHKKASRVVHGIWSMAVKCRCGESRSSDPFFIALEHEPQIFLALFANCEYIAAMNLKPQDIYILLKLVALGKSQWSYASVAGDLFMSASEVHAGIKRAVAARLMHSQSGHPLKKSLEEFLIHGVKYAFPPDRGGLTGASLPDMQRRRSRALFRSRTNHPRMAGSGRRHPWL